MRRVRSRGGTGSPGGKGRGECLLGLLGEDPTPSPHLCTQDHANSGAFRGCTQAISSHSNRPGGLHVPTLWEGSAPCCAAHSVASGVRTLCSRLVRNQKEDPGSHRRCEQSHHSGRLQSGTSCCALAHPWGEVCPSRKKSWCEIPVSVCLHRPLNATFCSTAIKSMSLLAGQCSSP